MLDGLPLHFFKQGDDGDGHIGGQKQREGKTVENFLVVFAVNLLPLRDRCEQAHTEQRSVREQDRFEQGHEPQAKAPARQEQIEQGDADIDNAHGQGKQNYGKDGQRKVDPGKAVAGNGAEKLAAIVVKDLEIPFGPAHALAAGLAEGDRLFVVHDRGAAVGDALALDHAVDGP